MATEQELLKLSKLKWDWMSERNVDALDTLFDDQAVFVHMGATMTKSQELDVIKSGVIQYRDIDIQEVSVRIIGTTAIVLNKIKLVAVVGGNEVTNPFMVTEVYVQEGGTRKLVVVHAPEAHKKVVALLNDMRERGAWALGASE